MNTNLTKNAFKNATEIITKGDEFFTLNKKNKLLKLYFNYLKQTDSNKNTTRLKLKYVIIFIKYLSDNKININKLSIINVHNYINLFDELNLGYSEKDRNKYHLKNFLNWCYSNNYIKISGNQAIPKIIWHRNEKVRSFYTEEEITKLMNTFKLSNNYELCNFLITSFAIYLGLRISDILNLKIDDINFKNKEIKIVIVKTGEVLFLPLIDEIRYPLIQYLKNNMKRIKDYIFIDKNGIKIKSNTYNYNLKKHILKADININNRKCGPHSLRHSFAKSLLKNNISLYDISKILGHQHLDTTIKYLEIDIDNLRNLALEVPIC